MLDGAQPLGYLHIDGTYSQAMTLCIFYQYSRRIKTHRLIIKNGAGKRGQITHLEVSGSIRNQRKTGGMRFWEAVEREGSNVLDYVFLGSCIDSILGHAAA